MFGLSDPCLFYSRFSGVCRALLSMDMGDILSLYLDLSREVMPRLTELSSQTLQSSGQRTQEVCVAGGIEYAYARSQSVIPCVRATTVRQNKSGPGETCQIMRGTKRPVKK